MILFLLQNTVNEFVLEHGMLSRFKSAENRQKQGTRSKQKQKVDSDLELDDDGDDSDDLFGVVEESSSEGDSDETRASPSCYKYLQYIQGAKSRRMIIRWGCPWG